MKRLISTIFLSMAVLFVLADDFTYDGIVYTVLSDNTVEVNSPTNSSVYSIVIPSQVNGYSVTSIGKYAFSFCKYLTSVTIPNSVTSIGNGAFFCCDYLNSINIPNNVKSIGDSAFSGCSRLTSVTIPDGVTSIGYQAFEGCSGLTSITIPNSVTSIGYMAFSECSGLQSISVDDGNTVYDSRDNCNAIINTATNTLIAGCRNAVIPNGVTRIENYAFSGCSGLKTVAIPNSVTSIGSGAFYACSGLTSITIPNSVTSIDSSAFEKCSSLTSVTINSNSIVSKEYTSSSSIIDIFGTQVNKYIIGGQVTSIGSYAFYGSTVLTSVTLHNSLTSIGEKAFFGCTALTSVTLPNSVTEIGDGAFRNCSSLTSVTINSNSIVSKEYTSSSSIGNIFGTQVKEFIIGDQVTGIGSYAFYGCSGLTSVTIPNSVTSIGDCAFNGCSSLTSVTIDSNSIVSKDNSSEESIIQSIFGTQVNEYIIGDHVTSIGSYAFYGCSNLSTVTFGTRFTSLGSSACVKSIGICAFSGCSGLTSVRIPESVTSIASYAFSGCSGLTSVKIPNSEISIEENAFNGCSGLTSVGIPERVTSIASYAFSGCSALTSVTINNHIVSKNYSPDESIKNIFGTQVKEYIIPGMWYRIGSYAFNGCSSLTSVSLPNVEIIGDNAFKGCSGLTSVSLPCVTSIGKNAFNGCSGLKEVTIPNHVESIGYGAFLNCSSLTSVTINSNSVVSKDNFYVETVLKSFFGTQVKNYIIGDQVTRIGKYAFYGSTGLKSVTIPNSVTSIGDCAFNGCSGLTSIIIPNSVTSIGENAFKGCSGLKDVYVMSEDQSSIDCNETSFTGCYTATLHIPYGEWWSYNYSSPWCYFKKIVDIPVDRWSNSKKYTIITRYGNRGYLGVNNGHLVSSKSVSITSEASFAIIHLNGSSYLYSIADKKFITSTGKETDSPQITDTWTKYSSYYGDGEYFMFKNSSGLVLNVNSNYNIVISSWGQTSEYWDDGNQFTINEAGDFDPAEALAMFYEYATGISLNKSSLGLTKIGTYSQLIATVKPGVTWDNSVTWTSSNTAVATVNANGWVTAIANGTATITARTTDGTNLTASCLVTISDLSTLSSAKQYHIHTKKKTCGTLGVFNGHLASTNYYSTGKEWHCDSGSSFAIINNGGFYYLYSIADKKFITSTGDETDSPQITDAWMVDVNINGYFMFKNSSGLVLNVNNNPGIEINEWGQASATWDDGNQFTVEEAGNFDPAEALAMFDSEVVGVTDNQYQAALASVLTDAQHTIYTLQDGTRYYLTREGYLTAETKEAGIFTFMQTTGDDLFRSPGWKLDACFSNPKLSEGASGALNTQGHILTDTGNNRDNWEGQVWYLGANGCYAVRATNANDTRWGAQTFWTVLDSNSDGQPEADYSWLPAYIWQLDDKSPTGIQVVDNEQWTMDNSIYDLSGRHVGNGQRTKDNGKLQKGVYIVNGKKVLVK